MKKKESSRSAIVPDGPAPSQPGSSQGSLYNTAPSKSLLPINLLTIQQKWVLEQVKEGKNVFIGGAAGTGKSALLCHIIAWAKKQYGSRDVAVTASTGIAARNISLADGISGRSIHSWAGIWTGKEDLQILVDRVQKSSSATGRWRSVKLLIIDEISMLDRSLFDKLESIARCLRHTEAIFGGIQIVITGDFFQLPPVAPSRSSVFFAFEANSWDAAINSQPIFLKKIFRQSDGVFLDLLGAIRVGTLSYNHITLLRQLQRQIHYPDGIEAAQLYSNRDDVERYNNRRLGQINKEQRSYVSDDWNEGLGAFASNMMAVDLLKLKLGAQVMLIKNIPVPGEHVNGDIGIVVNFISLRDAIEQGMSIVGIAPDDSNPGRDLESALARVQGKLRLEKGGFDPEGAWPAVLFTDGKTLLCPPQRFYVTGPNGDIEGCRFQIPLILAWAISIHKSQGQTFPRVVVDLSRIFEYGQMYVALSRATTMEGLEIINLPQNPRSMLLAHPNVLSWYDTWKNTVPYPSPSPEKRNRSTSESRVLPNMGSSSKRSKSSRS